MFTSHRRHRALIGSGSPSGFMTISQILVYNKLDLQNTFSKDKEMNEKKDQIEFTRMPTNYLGRYGDVVLEQFPAMEKLLDQLHQLPRQHRQHFADYLAKFGMQLSQPGKFPALEQVMLRLLQLPS